MSDLFAEIRYQKNFLREVIARIDFLNPLPGMDLALPAPLTEEAIRAFPIPEPHDVLSHEVQFGPEGVTKASEERIKEWHFHGKERTKTLTIGRQVVLVRHKMYQTYDPIKAEFVRILEQIDNLFPNIQAARIGLRYINQIELTEGNPTDWSAYIAPELLSLFRFPSDVDQAALSRILHNLELSYDTFNLRCRFGMHNPDYPARIKRKIFILDLDSYVQSVVEVKEISRLLDEFHSTIQRYFEQSITDNLRRIMNAD